VLSPGFQGADKKRGSGLTLTKPRSSGRGVEGLTDMSFIAVLANGKLKKAAQEKAKGWII
jgi:hypothetical protein